MKNKDLGILNSLKESPILLEKTCSILTDNFRVLALQKNYYETKAIEFISEDITPKNILIRAIKNTKMSIEKYEKEYDEILNFIGFNPKLKELLKKD